MNQDGLPRNAGERRQLVQCRPIVPVVSIVSLARLWPNSHWQSMQYQIDLSFSLMHLRPALICEGARSVARTRCLTTALTMLSISCCYYMLNLLNALTPSFLSQAARRTPELVATAATSRYYRLFEGETMLVRLMHLRVA